MVATTLLGHFALTLRYVVTTSAATIFHTDMQEPPKRPPPLLLLLLSLTPHHRLPSLLDTYTRPGEKRVQAGALLAPRLALCKPPPSVLIYLQN